MTTGPDERAAWEAIVADLATDPAFRSPAPPPAVEIDPESLGIPELPDADSANPDLDDGSRDAFDPPEPPPIPRPVDTVARFAWAGVVGGPVVLLLDYVLALGRIVSVAGLVLAIGGFVTLIARKREQSPDERWGEDHFGDGAIR